MTTIKTELSSDVTVKPDVDHNQEIKVETNLENGFCESINENYIIDSHVNNIKLECDSNDLQENFKAEPELLLIKQENTEEFQSEMSSGLEDNLNFTNSENSSDTPAVGKIFKCNLCDYSTTVSMKYLKNHMTKHNVDELYKCAKCDYETHVKKYLKAHSRTHFKEKQFRCKQCDYKTTIKGYLVAHKQVHLNNKELKCTECEYKCNTKSALYSHQRVHRPNTRFKCHECQFVTNLKYKFRKHLLIHSDDKPYSCDQCDFVSKRLEYVNVHKKMHMKASFKCDICGFETNFKQSYKSHIASHTAKTYCKKESLVCTICNYGTTSKDVLEKHMETHKPYQQKTYRCDRCWFNSKDITLLVTHMKTHLK